MEWAHRQHPFKTSVFLRGKFVWLVCFHNKGVYREYISIWISTVIDYFHVYYGYQFIFNFNKRTYYFASILIKRNIPNSMSDVSTRRWRVQIGGIQCVKFVCRLQVEICNLAWCFSFLVYVTVTRRVWVGFKLLHVGGGKFRSVCVYPTGL